MIRVGTVAYLNADPLTWALPRDRYEVVADLPSGIAAALAEGEVDVALLPVAALLDDPSLGVVPGVCVGADGPVESVVIAAETPPEAWTELLLDGSSRTSVTLARLLVTNGPLAARVRPDLKLVPVPPHTAPARVGGTVAGVVIGDPARALPDHLERHDLAALWKAWTGLPFVFAVWAAHDDLPAAVRDDLKTAGLAGLAEIPERTSGDDLVYLTERIRHRLDEPALMGLRRFAALAHAAGLVATEVVRFVDPVPASLPRANVDALLTRAADGSGLSRDEALALWTHAPLADLAAAADARKRALHGDLATYALAEGAPDTAVRLELVGLAPEPLVDAIDRLRHDLPASVTVALALPAGSLVEPGRPSTTTWLRAVALVRLALPQLRHLTADVPSQGLEAAQLALLGGADDLGALDVVAEPVPGVEAFGATVAEAERAIRTAGLRIARRDADFRVVGEALTQARRVRPVEERAGAA